MAGIIRERPAGYGIAVAAASRIAVCFTFLLCCWCGDITRGGESCFREAIYRDHAGEHRYAIFVPEHYTPDRRWPVMLSLHGAGEKGTDGKLPLMVGLGPMLRDQPNFPFIVVLPQCEDVDGRYLTGWLAGSEDANRALNILAEVEQLYATDPHQRVLCGWSMGGYGAFSLAESIPNHWSAVLVLAGGGNPADVVKLAAARTPLWAIHGELDSLVRVEQSQRMVQAIHAAGGSAMLSELQGVDHNVWKVAFSEPQVTQWLLDPQSVDAAAVNWDQARAKAAKLHIDYGFKEIGIVRQAIGVRIGNDALHTLAEGIPHVIRSEEVSGKLPDIRRSFGEGADRLDIAMTEIHYSCKVMACRIHAVSGGRFRVMFGLNPITMRVGASSIKGETIEANAGPFQIELGHRRPVWLDMEVRPEADSGRVRLKSLREAFEFTDENWYVSRPESVQVVSGDIKPDHIVTGIVGGLYLQKEEIEAQVRGVVPGLLESIEQGLNEINTDQLTSVLWPLPVLSPQFRLRPSDIETDRNGVSVLLDVIVGTTGDEQGATVPPSYETAKVRRDELGSGTELSLLASLNLIEVLASAVASTGMARINVLDIPEPRFAELSNPEFLHRLFPQLSTDDTEFRALVMLKGPFALSLTGKQPQQDGRQAAALDLSSDDLWVSFYGRKLSGGAWEELDAAQLNLHQRLLVSEIEGPGGRRGLQVAWEGEAQVQARLSSQLGDANSSSLLETTFSQAWSAWASSQPDQVTNIPGFETGPARLPWSNLLWIEPDEAAGATNVLLRFDSATTMFMNSSREVQGYEVRGPSSGWSGPYFLPADGTHRFHVGYPLEVRRFGGRRDALVAQPGESIDLGAIPALAPGRRR